jgi:hypothetical protein
MSMQQQGDEVNYKVKLGRAGAVLMPSRVSHSEDEDEMTAIVALTDSPTLSKMVVRGQEEGRDAEKDDSDAEAEAVEEDSTAQRRSAPHRPMLAKDMKATASKLVVEADLHVQNADETEEVQETGEGAGEWKDGAAFAEELEAEGLPLTVRENDFAAAIEKMQTYIDLNARKKAEGGSDQACADDASSVGSKPALNPYASSMKSRLDSLKSQVLCCSSRHVLFEGGSEIGCGAHSVRARERACRVRDLISKCLQFDSKHRSWWQDWAACPGAL